MGPSEITKVILLGYAIFFVIDVFTNYLSIFMT
jgi:hypothetical protein